MFLLPKKKKKSSNKKNKKILTDEEKERRRIRKQERRAKLRDWLDTYKSSVKCVVCRERHPATLDFHHKDPSQKTMAVSKMPNYGCSIEKIMQEINKCVVLCSNCHRKLHWLKGDFEAPTEYK